MAQAVFFNLPAFGHINVTLAYVRELVARGERVVYYATPPFRDIIEASGAEYRPYPAGMRQTMQDSPSNAYQIAEWIIGDAALLVPALLEELRNDPPRYIIHDLTCLWARILARLLHVPTVTTYPVFVMGPKTLLDDLSLGWHLLTSLPRGLPSLLRCSRTAWQMWRRYGVAFPPGPRALISKGDFNVVFLDRVFQLAGERYGDNYVFVGPSLGGTRKHYAFPMEWLNGKPLILVSMGTLFNERPAFYRKAAQAFGSLDVQVVIATGEKTAPESLGPLPANCLAVRQMPQVALLERASLFVTHGGMNSVSESIWHGVPVITVPQIIEQRLNGRRAQVLGAGELLSPEWVTVKRLRALAERVLTTPRYRATARILGRRYREGGGAAQAAEATLGYLRSTDLDPLPPAAPGAWPVGGKV